MWCAADAVYQAAVARTRPEEPNTDLGILQVPQSSQEGLGLRDSGRRVGRDEVIIADCCPKQLKVALNPTLAIRGAKELGGEVRVQVGGGGAAGSDGLALRKVELQAQGFAPLLYVG